MVSYIYTVSRSVKGDTVSIEYTFTRNTFTIIQFNIPVNHNIHYMQHFAACNTVYTGVKEACNM
uniref:Uncharacterized protein n=1 Tax=Amphimedon queenslandica TaxID=400682 RepID=A0A1X7TGE5_AMPQE